MCEICKSLLAAEHTEQPRAELCPVCGDSYLPPSQRAPHRV